MPMEATKTRSLVLWINFVLSVLSILSLVAPKVFLQILTRTWSSQWGRFSSLIDALYISVLSCFTSNDKISTSSCSTNRGYWHTRVRVFYHCKFIHQKQLIWLLLEKRWRITGYGIEILKTAHFYYLFCSAFCQPLQLWLPEIIKRHSKFNKYLTDLLNVYKILQIVL